MVKKVSLGSVDLNSVPKDFSWFPVVTQFNYEEKYIENVMLATKGTHFENLIDSYYIPIKFIKKNEFTKNNNWEYKIHKIKGCYSNYVFIKCKLTEDLWNLLRTTTGVAVILSTGGIPVPLSEAEMNHIKYNQRPEGFEKEEEEKLMKKINRFQKENFSNLKQEYLTKSEKENLMNYFKAHTILFKDIPLQSESL